jgi:hypothetical protein
LSGVYQVASKRSVLRVKMAAAGDSPRVNQKAMRWTIAIIGFVTAGYFLFHDATPHARVIRFTVSQFHSGKRTLRSVN